MVTVQIDDETAKQLAQFAAQRAISVENLAEVAIRSFLRAEADQILEREANAFAAIHPELLIRFPGEFVAIHQQQLVDHDADQAALYLRVLAQYPDEIVLIRQVRSTPEMSYTIRSPRLVHE